MAHQRDVSLGDKRREQRAVEVAARLARRPSDNLPEQMGSWAQQKAAYRLLDNDEVRCQLPPALAGGN